MLSFLEQDKLVHVNTTWYLDEGIIYSREEHYRVYYERLQF